MKERIVIIFIAVTLGLILTTFGFFLYENAKPSQNDQTPSPTRQASGNTQQGEILLAVDEPVDESITEKRTITVKGKTDPENILIISTNQEDTVATPTATGSFTASVSIDTGINEVIIRAVTPTGEEVRETRIVSFSPEDF